MAGEKVKLIIDTDGGIDDGIALVYALRNLPAHMEIAAITTCYGNSNLENATRNVAITLDSAGDQNTKVYKGAPGPLIKSERTASAHGLDGFNDVPVNPPREGRVMPERAVDTMIRIANENPGNVEILTLGPLTNLALALKLDPSLKDKVKKLWIMGGSIYGKTQVRSVGTEFNIAMDAEAAWIVLNQSNLPTFLITWDLCVDNEILYEDYKDMFDSKSSNEASKLFGRIMFSQGISRYSQVALQGLPMNIPDVTAVAICLDPTIIIQSCDHKIHVELKSDVLRGATTVDWNNADKENSELKTIVLKIDYDAYIERMKQAFQ